jgi:hypothetical protein
LPSSSLSLISYPISFEEASILELIDPHQKKYRDKIKKGSSEPDNPSFQF